MLCVEKDLCLVSVQGCAQDCYIKTFLDSGVRSYTICCLVQTDAEL